MSGLVAIAYKSHAVRGLATEELDALLSSARTFNSGADVTGALFHHGGRFFQYIEGPVQGIAGAFNRIKGSSLHEDIVELASQPIGRRQFAAWHMGFCEAPASALQQLSNMAWEDAMPLTRGDEDASDNLRLVLHYWNWWTADRPVQ